MLRFCVGSVVGIFTFVSPLFGASPDTVQLASDTTRVKVEADAATGSRKFTAPPVRFTARDRTDGFAIVSRTVGKGAAGSVEVSGLVRYPEDFRSYDHATFKDGKRVDFQALRDSSEWIDDTFLFTEEFKLQFSDEQLAHYVNDYDKVPVLVRSTESERSFVIYIPINHFAAVLEVSQR
jgi:hypothetical protein|tara:strand:- start:2946 stop:3482 length:537 start_codon:yes stop_codon:yes gene_type:complete